MQVPSYIRHNTISDVRAACYYPNGNVASDAHPCGESDEHLCCPFQWQCLDNGLCYDPVADIIGRYSCSNRFWNTTSCPRFCIYGGFASGNEAILACDNGRYCCNKDRQSGDCCLDQRSEFVDLPSGRVFATIESKDRPAAATSATGPSLPDGPQVTSSSTDSGDADVVSESGAVSSNRSNSSTAPAIPTASHLSTTTAKPEPPNPNMRIAIGCAVGIPTGLLLAGVAGFLVWRHHRQARKLQGDAVAEDYGAHAVEPPHDQYSPVEIDGTELSPLHAPLPHPEVASEAAETSRAYSGAQMKSASTHSVVAPE